MFEEWKKFIFIDPNDKEYSETLIYARRKLESPLAQALPCKRKEKQHSSFKQLKAESQIGNGKEFKSMSGCMVESPESTRQRPESSQQKNMKIALLGKD